MTNFILKLPFTLFLILCLFISCDSDDSTPEEPCDPPPLNENIIGLWSPDFSSFSIRFNENETVLDPEDILLGGEINGIFLTEKLYEVLSETELYVKVQDPNGTGVFLENTFTVIEYGCDEFVLVMSGSNVEFTRL